MAEQLEQDPDLRARPRPYGARGLRWMMSLYPPLLFAGVRWRWVDGRCTAARIEVRRSLLNRNLNGSIFGGALSAAVDPAPAVLLWQALALRGTAVEAWTAGFQVEFVRAARSTVRIDLELDLDDLERIEAELAASGRARRTHELEGVDREGAVCVRFRVESVLHDPRRRGQRDSGEPEGQGQIDAGHR
jgi:acyl-coenzyme A thioesterase PaaI-like protein